MVFRDMLFHVKPVILIMDDEVDFLGYLQRCLEPAGFDVILAQDGDVGLKFLRKGVHVDLMLCDLIMPNKEGLETLMELREVYTAIPVMVMSGAERSKNGGYFQLALKLGASSTLPKPFSRATLLEEVRRYLPASKLHLEI